MDTIYITFKNGDSYMKSPNPVNTGLKMGISVMLATETQV